MRRGIGNYLHHLLGEFAKRDDGDSFVLYVDDDVSSSRIPADSRFEVRRLGPKFYPAFEQVTLPTKTRGDKIELLHCPGNTAPVFISPGVPIVLTLFDTIFFLDDEILRSDDLTQMAQNKYYRVIAPRGARAAAQIITASEFSKRDIIRRFAPLRAPVSVIHLGPGSFSDAPERNAEMHGVPSQNLILSLGARDPRKNTHIVLEAFAKCSPEAFADYVLVVAGMDEQTRGRIESRARELGILDRTRLLGFVSDEELAALYRTAEMFVFPSLYEGFGLPVLEAMKFGTAVIASDRSSIPEIVGDAALLFDPTDSAALAMHMTRLANDAVLRRNLVSLGIARAATFSWAKTAAQTRQVYERALAGALR